MQRLTLALPVLNLREKDLGDIFWGAETDAGDRKLGNRIARQFQELSESLPERQMRAVRAFVENVLIVGAAQGLRYGYEVRNRHVRKKNKDATVDQLLKHQSIRELLQSPIKKKIKGKTITQQICLSLDNLQLDPPEIIAKDKRLSRLWNDNVKHAAVKQAISRARRKVKQVNSDISYAKYIRSTIQRGDAKEKTFTASLFDD